MRLEVTIPNILLMVLTTFIFSVLLVPIFKKVAFHIKALDYPNKRRLNKDLCQQLVASGFLCFLVWLYDFWSWYC